MKSPNIYSRSINHRGFALRQSRGGFTPHLFSMQTSKNMAVHPSPFLKAFKKGEGFTLMEVIVVIGMFAIVLGAGMAFGFDSYRGYLFRAEYTNAAHIIATARNRSANNFNENQHGVYFAEPDKYVLFVGNDYGASDPDTHETFPKSQEFSINGPDVIVFEQLSGNVDSSASGCGGSTCEVEFDAGGVRYIKLDVNEVGGITFDNS